MINDEVCVSLANVQKTVIGHGMLYLEAGFDAGVPPPFR